MLHGRARNAPEAESQKERESPHPLHLEAPCLFSPLEGFERPRKVVIDFSESNTSPRSAGTRHWKKCISDFPCIGNVYRNIPIVRQGLLARPRARFVSTQGAGGHPCGVDRG